MKPFYLFLFLACSSCTTGIHFRSGASKQLIEKGYRLQADSLLLIEPVILTNLNPSNAVEAYWQKSAPRYYDYFFTSTDQWLVKNQVPHTLLRGQNLVNTSMLRTELSILRNRPFSNYSFAADQVLARVKSTKPILLLVHELDFYSESTPSDWLSLAYAPFNPGLPTVNQGLIEIRSHALLVQGNSLKYYQNNEVSYDKKRWTRKRAKKNNRIYERVLGDLLKTLSSKE
jgi:hypothetical protein